MTVTTRGTDARSAITHLPPHNPARFSPLTTVMDLSTRPDTHAEEPTNHDEPAFGYTVGELQDEIQAYNSEHPDYPLDLELVMEVRDAIIAECVFNGVESVRDLCAEQVTRLTGEILQLMSC